MKFLNNKRHLSSAFSVQSYSCTAGILLCAQESGRYLALHHGKEDVWGLPGCGIAGGETAEAAALRGLRAQTGCEGSFLSLKPLPEHVIAVPNGVLRYHPFLAVVEKEFMVRIDPHETVGWQWVRGFEGWPLSRGREIDALVCYSTRVAAGQRAGLK